jgi:hypothetical protein
MLSISLKRFTFSVPYLTYIHLIEMLDAVGLIRERGVEKMRKIL